jgi:hypothetical protein
MFIENTGQFPDSVLFQVWSRPTTMWLAEDAIWITVVESSYVDTLERSSGRYDDIEREDKPLRSVNLKLSFPGANPHPRLEPFDRLDTVVSYFTGSDPAQWRPAVPVWGGVRYLDLYPGVDLVVGATLPWRLEVRDGADLSAVRLRVEGADAVALGSGQHLRLTTSLGDFTLPLLTVEGTRAGGQPSSLGVSPAMVFNTNGTFEVAHPFSASTPNPQPFDTSTGLSASWAQGRSATHNLQSSGLLYSTFVGGGGDDEGLALVLDSDGNAVVTGGTRSSNFPTTPGAYNFPTTPGAYNTIPNGSWDVFVLKLKLAAGADSLLYSTFVGGSGDDQGSALALDSDGNVVVTGGTQSSNFPPKNAYDSGYNGSWDVFVLKLAADGSSLLYSTFVGGSSGDRGFALALDGDGNAVVTGQTQSSNFPTKNAYDPDYNGNYDVFVLKLKLAAGADSLLYSTFVGGSSDDWGSALALDDGGNAVVTGRTYSSGFPTQNAYDPRYNGSSDVFVLKLKLAAGADSLLYSTFVGGSGNDEGLALALDDAGNAVVTGGTQSSNFPPKNAYDSGYNGSWDVFVLKLAADGSSLLYSTFVGGSSWDKGLALALYGDGSVGVTGETWYSNDFPTKDAYDPDHNGNYDVFVFRLKLAAGADSLLYSSFVGGSSADHGQALALRGDGAVVAGKTWSSDPVTGFPTTDQAYDRTHNGGSDVFVLLLDEELADTTPTPTPTITDTPTTITPTPTDTPGTPTYTPTPTDTPTYTPTPTDTPTPTYTPTPTDTPTPTYTPTPTDTPTSTPMPTATPTTPTTVVWEYCCSPGDRIYRIDGSSFYGYDTDSAYASPLKHIPSPPAPWGWNQLYVDPYSSWQPAIGVWWDNWNWHDSFWKPLPANGKCRPIGLQDKNGNQEGQSKVTHLYRREFDLRAPSGMQVTEAILEMWSDNKTAWWWWGGEGGGSVLVSHDREGYIGRVDLFPRLIRPQGGIYVLAIQNSNDRASPLNPQGTACYLRVTWAVPREPGQVYLPLILKKQP